jgi:hypothetical protein
MSTMLEDVVSWRSKVLREEPYTQCEVSEATESEWQAWREWVLGG